MRQAVDAEHLRLLVAAVALALSAFFADVAAVGRATSSQ
jgi:hypothetical protein